MTSVRGPLRILLITALILATAVFAGMRWVHHYIHEPVPITEPVVFVVEPGASLRAVARNLEARGAIEHPRVWAAHARVHGLAKRIRAGEYQIDPGATPASVLDQLVKGDVILRELTIVEGWSFRDLMHAIANHPALQQTLHGASEAEIMERVGSAGVHPEGQFFPDTYRFAGGTPDVELLRMAHEALRARLQAAWDARVEGLPVESPYEALILASIVEKETGLASERPLIAGVFVRRLRTGMRLQSDPTVIYGIGVSYDGNIRRRDLQADSPYNTYTRRGLPPTPIAMPGEGALRAATRPDDSGAIYFVATGEPDGSHYFSKTLAEHNAAVKRFLARVRSRAASTAPPANNNAR
jgi:peptidoglycan lytic transglycosylase G